MNYIPPKLTLLVSTLLVVGYVAFSSSFAQEKDIPSAAISEKNPSEKEKRPKVDKEAESNNSSSDNKSLAKEQLPRVKDVMKKARNRLMSYESIRANIKESVVFGDRQFQATGSYLQGTELRLRLEFTVTINKRMKGTLFQVCDGDILWTHLKIGNKEQVTRRVVRDILKAAAADGKLSENILVAQLGLGGLPALLASLEQNMVLNKIKEEKIEGISFYVVQGRWNDSFLKLWEKPALGVEDKRKNKSKTSPLPSRVPDRVRIYLEKKTLFPQRILYLKKHPDKPSYKQMVLLDFQNVKFNTQVNNEDFRFIPPDGVQQDDDTKRYIDRLNMNKKKPRGKK